MLIINEMNGAVFPKNLLARKERNTNTDRRLTIINVTHTRSENVRYFTDM